MPLIQKFGVYAALATPFDENGVVDFKAMVSHADWVLGAGADGVALFGTTGEGASLALSERLAGIDMFLASDFDPEQLVSTIYATSAEEAAEQIRAHLTRGITRLMLLPPYYFKGVDDAGLYDWFAAVLRPFRQTSVELIFYHIPQVTEVPLSAALINRLKNEFEGLVWGVKDSSGDFGSVQSFVAIEDLHVLVGDERLLGRAGSIGASGTISGIANMFPARLSEMLGSHGEDDLISALVNAVVEKPVIPAIKGLLALLHEERSWQLTRAPLAPLELDAMDKIIGVYDTLRKTEQLRHAG